MAHAQTPEHPWVLPRGQLRHPAGGRQVGRGQSWGWGRGGRGLRSGLRCVPCQSTRPLTGFLEVCALRSPSTNRETEAQRGSVVSRGHAAGDKVHSTLSPVEGREGSTPNPSGVTGAELSDVAAASPNPVPPRGVTKKSSARPAAHPR